MICSLCPRGCGAERGSESGKGFCGMGTLPVVARAALHMWEEPCISGERGSGTVFFSGCQLGCVFCQNYSISHENTGKVVSVERLREIFLELKSKGAHNINLVSASHFIPAVAEALSEPAGIPVVFNTGGYDRPETLDMLSGKADIYLPDIKFYSEELSAELAAAPDYFRVASRAVLHMLGQAGGAELGDDGMMRRGVMVRHLVLPGHTEDSLRILEWIADNLPRTVPVSLMCQYIPAGRAADYPPLHRKLTRREYNKVVDRLFALGLDNGFVQEMGSADERFVPAFNLEGV